MKMLTPFFQELETDHSFHHSLQAQASRHLPELLPLSGKNANQLLQELSVKPRPEGPQRHCVQWERNMVLLGGWAGGEGGQPEKMMCPPRGTHAPTHSPPSPSVLGISPPERTAPGGLIIQDGGVGTWGRKTLRTCFLHPPATPAIPGKGLGIFS